MNTKTIDNLWMLSSKEKKTRTAWAIIFFAQLLASTIYIYYIMSTLPGSAITTTSMIVSLAFSAFLSYLYYQCVYKKHGIIWLTIYLILTPLTFYKAIVDVRHSSDPTVINAMLLFLPIAICLYVVSFFIRPINKKIVSKTLEISEEYKAASASIREASSLKDLKLKLDSSIQGKPRYFIRALKKEYKAKKSSLNS